MERSAKEIVFRLSEAAVLEQMAEEMADVAVCAKVLMEYEPVRYGGLVLTEMEKMDRWRDRLGRR